MKQIAIIGAGTMGHSLAQAFAQGGYQVFLNDVSEAVLTKAQSLISSNLDTFAQAGLFDPSDKSKTLEQITCTTDLDQAVSRSDLVIEAIVEVPEAKKEMFSELDRLAPPEAILSSNTSYLDIYQFVETNRPEKVVITHWFAPPHIVPLVEIVQGPQTSAETVITVERVLKGLGKHTIVIQKFLPGFIANRLQAALALEAYRLIDEGYATPEDIDIATKASFGLRIPLLGLIKRADFAGLDLIQQNLKNKAYSPPPVRGKSDTIDSLVSEGNFGVKTRKGFYDYSDRPIEEILKERDEKLLKLRKFLIDMGEL